MLLLPDEDIMDQITTVLFQPPNRIGLGHISRLAAIALAIRDQIPSARLPFLVEGGSHSLLEVTSLPYFSLPAEFELYKTESWMAWPAEERNAMILSLADSIIHQLRPKIILFDTFPCIAAATAAARRGVPIALCLRKMKNMQEYFA